VFDPVRDRDTVGTAGTSGAGAFVGGGTRLDTPIGVLTPGALDRAGCFLDTRDTGNNLHFPLFSVLDPKHATTDIGENLVDAVWLRGACQPILIPLEFLVDVEEVAQPLADVLRDVRAKIDLPVSDVAAMCGIRRRQFYNLLAGRTATPDRERLIRALHEAVNEIDDATRGDVQRTRAAILTPVGSDRVTLFSAALNGEEGAVREIGAELANRIRAGRVRGMVPRPSPTLAHIAAERDASDQSRRATGDG